MRHTKIACLVMTLTISTLLTGCSLGNIPVVGKFFDKGADTQAQVPDGADGEDGAVQSDTPAVDGYLPEVAPGTVITIYDIRDFLPSLGIAKESLVADLLQDSTGASCEEVTVNEDTWVTYTYNTSDMEASEQAQFKFGIRVNGELPVETEETSEETPSEGAEQTEAEEPADKRQAVMYEVFEYQPAPEEFNYTSLDNGKLYLASVSNFTLTRIPFVDEYGIITKPLADLVSNYENVNDIANKFTVWCIPKAYIYMQASDYEDGADMSAYSGEYVIVLEPVYDNYTDDIYRKEEVLLLPLIDDINKFAETPSDETKTECNFNLNENFDDESTDIDDYYGAYEILSQLASTTDIFIFDEVLATKVVDYCDMFTPDNMDDDITWEEYESQEASTEQTTEEQTTGEQTTGTTVITETTTKETTVVELINSEIPNSFRSRHPELFSILPEPIMEFSRWDWRLSDSTTIRGTIKLPDGTILPPSQTSGEGATYNIKDGTSTGSTSSVFSSGSSSTSSTSGTSSAETTETTESTETTDMTTGSVTGTEEEEEEEESGLDEYTISYGNTTVLVESNSTYRYVIDNQNSSSSEVYIKYKDSRYTIKVVDDEQWNFYRKKDYLNRFNASYTLRNSKSYSEVNYDGLSIGLVEIASGEPEVVEPYMAYMINGTEHIIIIPDERDEVGSTTMADILKRCVSLK